MTEHTPGRKLTTILSADAAGFSRLMGGDEERTLGDLKDHRATIDALISKHDGRIFGSAGDSLVAEFPSPVEACRCAVEIQDAIASHNASLTESRRMPFRIGINLGDVMVDGANLFGDGVNVAARLQEAAEPGGIVISGTVHEQIEGRLSCTWRSLGERTFKNIARPVRVYGLGTPTPGGEAVPPRARAGTRWRVVVPVLVLAFLGVLVAYFVYQRVSSPPPSETQLSEPSAIANRTFIAVLPFENLSGDPAQDYFTTGIREDIVAALGRFADLAVIGAGATGNDLGATSEGLAEIGARLGVRYVLQGSVRRSGDQVRVTARLNDAETGLLLWSERYDRELEDVFLVQDDITQQVVRTLAVKLTRLERERALAKAPNNLMAYDLALRGHALMATATRESVAEAQELFTQAIALDPRYTAAYVGLAWTRYFVASAGWTEFIADALDDAEALARKALSQDPESSSAYRLLGYLHLYRKEYAQALEVLDQAIMLNPNDADSFGFKGAVLTYAGASDEAIPVLEAAVRLHPPNVADYTFNLGFAYYLQGRYEAAAKLVVDYATLRLDYFAYVVLAISYAQLDRLEEAETAAAQVKRLWPFFDAELFSAQFLDARDRAHIAEGLAKAGLD